MDNANSFHSRNVLEMMDQTKMNYVIKEIKLLFEKKAMKYEI